MTSNTVATEETAALATSSNLGPLTSSPQLSELSEKHAFDNSSRTPLSEAAIAILPHDDLAETPSEDDRSEMPSESKRKSHGLHFFLVFFSLCVCSFLSALDLTTVTTALPTIVADLENDPLRISRHREQGSNLSSATSDTAGTGSYIWIGAAYTIAGTAILPWTGGLCEIWGRKAILQGALLFFLIGSFVCGFARNMQVMIIGRALQGIGDGGIISLAEIVVADLVSLNQRGTYEGILGMVWAGASAIGPPIGGLFSRHEHWRWLFYINIPITVIAMILIGFFMHMKTPKSDVRTKLKEMDWTGNLLVIAATVGLGLSLTWGGIKYPWHSPAILVPLILSVLLFVAFFYLELFKFKNATLPKALLSNRTAISSHVTSLLHGLVTMAIIYLLPTYFQAVKLVSAIKSGWMVLPFSCTVAFTAIGFAISIELMQRYVPQNHLGWILTVAGVPLLLLLQVDSQMYTWVLVQLPIAAGCGILFVAPQFPVLASVSVQLASKALAAQLFFASFGQTLGIMLAEAMFQSSISQSIKSPEITALTANGTLPFSIHDISSPYSMHFGAIHKLTPEASFIVRSVYNTAIHRVWLLLIPFAVVGWFACFFLKELEMHDEVDERFAVDIKKTEDPEKREDKEKQSESSEKATTVTVSPDASPRQEHIAV